MEDASMKKIVNQDARHEVLRILKSDPPAMKHCKPSISVDSCMAVNDREKSWHDSITTEERINITELVVHSIFPIPDAIALQDKRFYNLVMFAKQMEGDMYETATSRDEYYRMLAEKIRRIEMELEEKRLARKRLQLLLKLLNVT